jgi:hypothetical protein
MILLFQAPTPRQRTLPTRSSNAWKEDQRTGAARRKEQASTYLHSPLEMGTRGNRVVPYYCWLLLLLLLLLF